MKRTNCTTRRDFLRRSLEIATLAIVAPATIAAGLRRDFGPNPLNRPRILGHVHTPASFRGKGFLVPCRTGDGGFLVDSEMAEKVLEELRSSATLIPRG